MIGTGYRKTSRWRYWMSLGCTFLVLVFAGLGATHIHTDAQTACGSSPCAICISVHANAPVASSYILPVLFSVETVAVLFQAEIQSITAELTLFIRPPPAI